MTSRLPPELLRLFTPRPPLAHVEPLDRAPDERAAPRITGIAAYAAELANAPRSEPTETPKQRKERLKAERAQQARDNIVRGVSTWDPALNLQATEDPYKTLIVARLNYDATEAVLRDEFGKFGEIASVKMVKDMEGNFRGYAFVEFAHESGLREAHRAADGMRILGRRVVVDVERGRTVKGWLPRRFGGGLGGTRIGDKNQNQREPGRFDPAALAQNGGRRYGEHGRDRPARPRDHERSRSRGRPGNGYHDSWNRRRDREHERDRDNDKDRDRSDRSDRRSHRRYFPGKAPDVARADLSASDSDGEQEAAPAPAQRITIPSLAAARAADDAVGLRSADDLDRDAKGLLQARLLARQQAGDDSSSSSSSSEDGGSSDESDGRRRAQALLRKQQHSIQDVGQPASGLDSGGASDSSSSPGDSDSDDGYAQPVLLKPMFVPKSQRLAGTQSRPLPASRSLGAGEEAGAESAEDQLRDRREASVRKAAEEARRTREGLAMDEQGGTMASDGDTDDTDVDAEFEAWRARELQRIKRDKEEQEAADQEDAERARVRGMTEEEREAAGIERAWRQREEKAQRVASLAAAAAAERPGQAAPAADASARAAQEMLEHALRSERPHFGSSKWRGYKAEDTSRPRPT
ncbi:hypothetical protein LPJ61_000791 [Coemansia biformis]|uniref:RRM domain-containing protein n=1 Tax=Coemansia biformis TaxID=1286918 RepID=A0A9W7YHN4_9FUNG|nr:hypothetical protein LPJ61_000791 [Coemansia biformis]